MDALSLRLRGLLLNGNLEVKKPLGRGNAAIPNAPSASCFNMDSAITLSTQTAAAAGQKICAGR